MTTVLLAVIGFLLAVIVGMVGALLRYDVHMHDLIEENHRLKSGNFTEEEFQNLCHNVSIQEGRARFEEGCRDYQRKLFGPVNKE